MLGLAGLRAGNGGVDRRFARVNGGVEHGLSISLRSILLFGLAGARLGFTRLACSNGITVVRFCAGLDDNRLCGIALFVTHPGQRGVDGILIFRRRLYRGLLVPFLACGFITLQTRLACFKSGFSFRRAFLFLTDSGNLRFFLAEVLYQRNITRADPGAGAALNTVCQVMARGFVVLLPFAEPVKLLRQQVGRAGVGAGAAADAAFLFFGLTHFINGWRQQAVGDFNDRNVQPRQGEPHQRAAHDHHLLCARAKTGVFKQVTHRCTQSRPDVARTGNRFAGQGDNTFGEWLTVNHRAFHRIGCSNVLHQNADVGGAPAVGNLFPGEDLRQLFGPSRRVLGRNDAQLNAVGIRQHRPQHRNGLRFIIFNADQHLAGL